MSGSERADAPATSDDRLGPAARVGLVVLVLWDLLRVRVGLRRRRLPDLVRGLERPPRLRHRSLAPRRLGRIVHRVLSPGPFEPRCLVSSLVFFRMLRRQGTPAELVIGLPPEPTSPDAHAWVEVDGEVAGPPPGRLGHSAMARYGATGGAARS